ncbi:MAG TPA: nicotinate-nucleotide adenylyltransferase [Candidatus Baltobacteraceae bacterium]|jgi:nicotinate-nucleotide adenylyltransferase|nr:nicotinate-nucleotide adenylyltransferase [Candidatus Baltobacteraceae bacterium]
MRLGIFGGTFDPIHNVHLFVAESARIMEGLDRVLFVPTNNVHYRSKPQAAPEHRCAMILGAIDSNRSFSLDETDLRPDSTGYTADLLPKIQAKYPDASLVFITGADSLASNAWVRFEDVLEALDSFVIAPRAGIRAEAITRVLAAVPPAMRSRVKTLNLPEMPESATLIRTLLSQGKSVRYLVPEPVWNYIAAQNLYGVEAPV